MSDFIQRHIGITKQEQQEMLDQLNYPSLEALITDTIPDHIRRRTVFSIDAQESESKLLDELNKIATKNILNKSFIGLGYYDCITPPVIDRNILQNPGWYTQYTPDQAEIAQGRLEALINYQTVITELTGLEIANASLLDEATAVVEAVIMLCRAASEKKNRLLVHANAFPQSIQVLSTRAKYLGIQLDFFSSVPTTISDDVFAIFYQSPDRYGELIDIKAIQNIKLSFNCPVICASDLMYLVLTKPNESVDVCIGTSQRFGVPLGYGGPHAAFFACKEEYSRKIPGRIIGASIDKYGKKAYRMALQTREQHIRKDKATSNICTAQALLAIIAGSYAVYHGPEGLRLIAQSIREKAVQFAAQCQRLGFQLRTSDFFDTVTIALSDLNQRKTLKEACKRVGINLNFSDCDYISVAFDETKSEEDVLVVLRCFEEIADKHVSTDLSIRMRSELFDSYARSEAFMNQNLFHAYRSESNLMRYLKSLETKDYSLTTGMIPLGSCTMKLNAATEMMPISFAGFSKLHPYCPKDQAKGYEEIISRLGKYLCHITSFDAVSFQPNSGAQGELAGLLTVKRYYEDKGDFKRNIALIPQSAHGTNPASAALAGLKIIPVNCLADGRIDVTDFNSKCDRYATEIAVFMVTYPSTYGVFENTIVQLCEKIHEIGAQVYMDGANLNAQVGLTDPNTIGADLCHINLHKTFAIPHGGGGPGMGPICVKKHLSDFLPQFSLSLEDSVFSVSAAEFSSASILLISYAYIELLGSVGLKNCTEIAILNANYIRKRLETYYPILFTGEKGNVAHELIIDCRPFKKSAGIEVEDIAKRLMDYSFHAPTLSWPVPGTLMIEPTESESKSELDRFCDALIQIYHEMTAIAENRADKDDNMLKNAPHPLYHLLSDEWNHAYTREQAAYPLESLKNQKFWPSVARLNQAQGDRQLICTCDSDVLTENLTIE